MEANPRSSNTKGIRHRLRITFSSFHEAAMHEQDNPEAAFATRPGGASDRADVTIPDGSGSRKPALAPQGTVHPHSPGALDLQQSSGALSVAMGFQAGLASVAGLGYWR